MKKTVFRTGRMTVITFLAFIFSLFAALPAVYGEDISFSSQCAGGGSRSATGTYDETSGEFYLEFIVQDCVIRNTILNGTIISSGVFKYSILGSTANIDSSTEFTGTAMSEGNSADLDCTHTGAGSYDLKEKILTGNMSTTCNSSGNFSIPLTDLLAGAFPF